MTEDQQLRFVTNYRETGNFSLSSRCVGLSPTKVKQTRIEQPAFDEACTEAEMEAADALEHAARKRAVEGVDKGVYHKGELVAVELQYSDTLLLALLKANKPDKFADRSKSEITGKDGQPVMGDTEVAAKLSSLLAIAAARMEKEQDA